jgi:hypothetical protein
MLLRKTWISHTLLESHGTRQARQGWPTARPDSVGLFAALF